MKSLLTAAIALAALTTAAAAGEPLTNQQMDKVTAGFGFGGFALAIADADAKGPIAFASTSTFTDVGRFGSFASSNSLSISSTGFFHH